MVTNIYGGATRSREMKWLYPRVAVSVGKCGYPQVEFYSSYLVRINKV